MNHKETKRGRSWERRYLESAPTDYPSAETITAAVSARRYNGETRVLRKVSASRAFIVALTHGDDGVARVAVARHNGHGGPCGQSCVVYAGNASAARIAFDSYVAGR